MGIILGIETSCDETSAAVVKDGHIVLSNIVASQISKHAVHGGVVPELAAREHLVALAPVVREALAESGVKPEEIDAIAVTNGPGLMPALLVGLTFAKGLSRQLHKPLIGINHFIAHIYAAFLDEEGRDKLLNPAIFPIMALVVSGGHSALLLIAADGSARLIGTTIDDAAGEALDKAAKLLGLGYPGGPVMDKIGTQGNPERFNFPRPLTGAAGKALPEQHKYNFSFSGVKTALLYHVNRCGGKLEGDLLNDTVASYQEAIVDVLCRKAVAAATEFNAGSIIISGGVACNSRLRGELSKRVSGSKMLLMAQRKYCTDNAAMVAGLAEHFYKRDQFSFLNLDAFSRLPQITVAPFVN